MVGNYSSSLGFCTNIDFLRGLILTSQKIIFKNTDHCLHLVFALDILVESTNDLSESILPFLHRDPVSYFWAPGCPARFHIPLALLHPTLSIGKSGTENIGPCSLFPYL